MEREPTLQGVPSDWPLLFELGFTIAQGCVALIVLQRVRLANDVV